MFEVGRAVDVLTTPRKRPSGCIRGRRFALEQFRGPGFLTNWARIHNETTPAMVRRLTSWGGVWRSCQAFIEEVSAGNQRERGSCGWSAEISDQHEPRNGATVPVTLVVGLGATGPFEGTAGPAYDANGFVKH